MPSIWEVAGETLGAPVLAPIVIGGAVVSAIASPEVRQRFRRWGVQGLAAALAAGDAARRELGAGTNGTTGLAAQIGHRLRDAVAEVREDWDDFVAEARTEQERRRAGRRGTIAEAESNGGRVRSRRSNGESNPSAEAIEGMDGGSSGSAAMHGSAATAPGRSRARGRRPRRS
jgi:hypothetical protein